jgi:transcriptional regulator with XRE-family HTH domain
MRQKKRATSQDDMGKRLGKAIAERRKALGFSQDDLAGTIEVDAETISRFERGAVLPSLQRLGRVAEALETGIGELLGEASDLPSDQAQKLVAALQGLDPKDRQLLLDFASLLRARSR